MTQIFLNQTHMTQFFFQKSYKIFSTVNSKNLTQSRYIHGSQILNHENNKKNKLKYSLKSWRI